MRARSWTVHFDTQLMNPGARRGPTRAAACLSRGARATRRDPNPARPPSCTRRSCVPCLCLSHSAFLASALVLPVGFVFCCWSSFFRDSISLPILPHGLDPPPPGSPERPTALSCDPATWTQLSALRVVETCSKLDRGWLVWSCLSVQRSTRVCVQGGGGRRRAAARVRRTLADGRLAGCCTCRRAVQLAAGPLVTSLCEEGAQAPRDGALVRSRLRRAVGTAWLLG